MALAAEAIGDRWTLLILREAFFGVARFADMVIDLGIARSVLTDRLAKLVDTDVLEQVSYREENSRTRSYYRLTERGRALAPVLIALMQWGEGAITGKAAPIKIVKRGDGRELRLQLVDDHGKVASLRDATVEITG